jgi:hypothetical protein
MQLVEFWQQCDHIYHQIIVASLHAIHLSLYFSLCKTREVYPSSISDFSNNLDEVQCTDHMCPVQVHWHVKSSYMSYWRVELTISNYEYQRNFSNWNMVVQHPGFSQPATTYSFNSTVLPTVGFGGTYSSIFLSTIDITYSFHNVQMLNYNASFFLIVDFFNSIMLKCQQSMS